MLYSSSFQSLRLEKEEKKTLKRTLPFSPKKIVHCLTPSLYLQRQSRIKIVESLFSETKQNKSNQFVLIIGKWTEASHTAALLNFCLNFYTDLYIKGELFENESIWGFIFFCFFNYFMLILSKIHSIFKSDKSKTKLVNHSWIPREWFTSMLPIYMQTQFKHGSSHTETEC